MRLASFISSNLEAILIEWDAFARGVWPSSDVEPGELRDHAAEILRAMVEDINSPQSAQQQTDKSKGQTQWDENLGAASNLHGLGRVQLGVPLSVVVSEYRALRASVLRLWRESNPEPDIHDIEDVTRFNESVDESLARAAQSFTEEVERVRQFMRDSELRDSEESYRNLFESIDQGFCVIEVLFDADEKPVDYRFLIVNQAFERQTGISNAVGRRMKDIAPEHEEHWFQIYGKIALTGERMHFENVAKQLDRYYDVSAWRVGGPAERKVAILFNDLTERKRAEEELKRAKEAAERANQAKDKFLAALSHELRTPLTPILAGSQLLTRREDLPVNAYSTLELIKRNVELEARLIDDLLDLSRVIHGKIQLCIERIDVHKVIRNAVDICRPRLNEKSQDLQLYLNAKQTTIEGDISRLQQCFWNLMINSVKFTSEYGRIIIATENQGKDVVIKVTDTGKGIDPVLLPNLFSAFEQGETGQSGGLGLGLTITKGLVELHHGTISAFSEGNGKGSTFSITLPASAEAEAEAEAEKAEFQPQPKSKSILLVEDNEDTGILMKAVLDGGGHRVHFARNVASALKAAEKEKFDLLLCDIGLPDGSGLDVVSSLRKSKAIDKAIAITGYGMAEDVEGCKRAGFDTHLTKPVNIEELERLVAIL